MNELCIEQLNTELSNKAAREVEMLVELEAVTKELDVLRTKLKYTNRQQAFAAEMLKNSVVHDIDSDDTFATAKQSTSSASSRAAKPSVSSAGSPVKARLTRSRSRTSLNFSEAQESFISCRNR